LELEPDDPTLLVLEGMLVAATGKPLAAGELIELLRAGPLTEEQLDEKLVLLRRIIRNWRWSPPGPDLIAARALPPDERWAPVKHAQQAYPDSADAALQVLLMRSELAGIDLMDEEEKQRMRTKILAAEPQAIATLEEQSPLKAAIITAEGEARDAARRVDDMLTPDQSAPLVFDEEDFAQLSADLLRIGLPHWALRTLRLQMARRGEVRPEDIAVWRELLPGLLGEEAAAELLVAWENDEILSTRIYATVPEPEQVNGQAVSPLWAGSYERGLRDATLVRGRILPVGREKEALLADEVQHALQLGRHDQAEAAMRELSQMTKGTGAVERQQLALAVSRQDAASAQATAAMVREQDRRLRASYNLVAPAEYLAGDWSAAAEAYARGFANKQADPIRRGFAALHAHGAAQVAGGEQNDLLRQALAVVPEQAWIRQLLLAALGELDREQLLSEAAEGSHAQVQGKRCEAYFALAFAPGRSMEGRRADMAACVDTGVMAYIEYDFAQAYLRQHGG
jgi:hypothetical protein